MAEFAAIVLAAGRASRYRAAGGAEPTKLVADYRGRPLVRWAVETALASRARPVVVVTGHARAEVEAALAGLDVAFVYNSDFAAGLSTSLRVGLAALPAGAAGALVLLGDMPETSSAVADALMAAFEANADALAAVALHDGQRGNPALLGRALFAPASNLSGDEGARALLKGLPAERVATVATAEGGVIRDVDRPEDLLGLAIRDAEPRDRSDILRGIVELQDWERRLSPTRRPGAEVAAAYFDKLCAEAAAGAFLVAEAHGVFAGFIVGWVEQDDQICETPDSNRYGYISDVCVLAGFRGRRMAQALLNALERRLVSSGVTRLRLNFLAGNVSAQAAYERAGYRPYEVRYEKPAEAVE